MYRIEIVEKDVYITMDKKYIDVERISAPTYNMDDLIKKLRYWKRAFKKELLSGKYYIKIEYVKIDKHKQ